jgi:hypothetical protein
MTTGCSRFQNCQARNSTGIVLPARIWATNCERRALNFEFFGQQVQLLQLPRVKILHVIAVHPVRGSERSPNETRARGIRLYALFRSTSAEFLLPNAIQFATAYSISCLRPVSGT